MIFDWSVLPRCHAADLTRAFNRPFSTSLLAGSSRFRRGPFKDALATRSSLRSSIDIPEAVLIRPLSNETNRCRWRNERNWRRDVRETEKVDNEVDEW